MRPRVLVTSTLAVTAALIAAGVAALVYGGFYDVAATRQHLQPVHSVLEVALRQSVRRHAKNIEAPDLADPKLIVQGAQCYQQKCVQCHGGPGIAQGDIGKGMQPLPGPLIDAHHRWRPRELYWITRNGIKMSGMPAWEFRLSERDLWAVVAFVGVLPDLTPARYAELAGTAWHVSSTQDALSRDSTCSSITAGQASPGNHLRGRRALSQYACNACHTIPGVTSSHPQIGPSLEFMGRRTRIAGTLDHTHENMVRWLRHTRRVKPGTAMPEMGLTEQDARDIAAYLKILR